MRKKLLMTSLAAVLAVGITACSPGGGATSSSSTSSAAGSVAAGTASPTGALAPSTITMWTSIAGPQGDVLDAFGKSFQTAHPGTTVTIIHMADVDLKQKVQAALVTKSLPTVIQWYGGSFLAPVTNSGALTDLTAYINGAPQWKAGLINNALTNYTQAGKTYMVPVEAPTVQLFYNKSLLSKAGVSAPPATWDQLIATVGKLKSAGITPITVDGQDGWPIQEWFTYLTMRNGGAGTLQAALDGKTPWTAPAFVTAGTQLKQLIDAGGFQNGYLGTGYDQAVANYANSKAAMILLGSWLLGTLSTPDNKAVLAQTGFVPFPTVPGGKGPITETQGGPNAAFGISSAAGNKDAAWEFIKGFTSTDQASKVAEQALSLVPNKITIDTTKVPAIYNDAVSFLGKSTAFNLFWNEVLPPQQNTKFTNLQNSMVAGQISPQQMMSNFGDYMKAHPVPK